MIQVRQKNKVELKPLAFRFSGDDETMAAAIKSGHPGAMEAMFHRYGEMVERLVVRVLGFDPEIPDLVQDIFVAAYSRIHQLRDNAAIRSWLTSLTILTVRQRIRKRARRRVHWAHDDAATYNYAAPMVSVEDIELLKLIYEVLDAMPTDERLIFALRFIDGMEIREVTQVLDVSESTVKRRLRKAEKRFLVLSRRFPVLEEKLEQSEKWSKK